MGCLLLIFIAFLSIFLKGAYSFFVGVPVGNDQEYSMFLFFDLQIFLRGLLRVLLLLLRLVLHIPLALCDLPSARFHFIS